MRHFSRTVLLPVVTALAVLAHPAQALATEPTGSEPTTVELRIELSSDSPPDVAAALTPGGSVDLVGTVRAIGGREADPSTCAASMSTPAGGATSIRLSQCTGSDLTASVDVATGAADVSYQGEAGTGVARLKWTEWGAIIVTVAIIVILILI